MIRTLDDIRELASQVTSLQKQARSLGLFPGDMELLDCPKCGLLEDVLIGGKLITYRDAEGEDTGLCFEELVDGNFKCPACRSIVQENNHTGQPLNA
jgi:hypothetical protein